MADTTDRVLPVGTRVEFRRSYGDGSVSNNVLGVASRQAQGWRFYPRVVGRLPSRKPHPTLEACIPRWVGYPDGCTSRLKED